MLNYLIGAAVALTAPAAREDQNPARCLDGAWTVVCYEKAGQPQPDATGMTVKADAGTITCSGADGKPAMTLKLVFGAGGTVQVTEAAGGDAAAAPGAARAGVYVLTRDFLAISVTDDAAGADKGAVDGPSMKARCSVILKREGARADTTK